MSQCLRRFSSLVGVCLWGVGAAFAADPAVFETPKPVPASPLTPEESRQHFQIDPDCRIELVAAEPDVSAPVSIAFDEKGQLWVVEMHDYPNGPAPGEPGKSRVRVLTDEDGDGRYSNPTVFVDGLLFANSLMHWDGGILVTTDGKLIYFKDTDNDGKADLREVWFEGFATENPQLRCNHPTLGPDNWIYVANGLRNGKVLNVRMSWPRKPAKDQPAKPEPVDIAGRDFRFNPFTGECEAVSGYGQFGLTFDDAGNRYVCSNRNPCMKVIIEERHLKLNPNLAVPSVYEDVSPAGEKSKLYPISRAWTTSNLHAGQFSAACGLIFYRGTSLPEKFYDKSFTCDPTGNLVHFNNDAYNESKREFLASDETWFRPVNTAMGPDGALYIVDMYRAVIEHPDYMPTELKTRPDLSIGAERGRIWRIKSNTNKPGGVSPRGVPLPTAPAEIAKLVVHPNGWHRDAAQRLLIAGQMTEAEPVLREIIQPQRKQTSVAESLRILDGLGVLKPQDLAELIQRDPLSTAKSNADLIFALDSLRWKEEVLRLSEPLIAHHPELEAAILKASQSGRLTVISDSLHRALGQLGDRGTEERLRLTATDLRLAMECQFLNDRNRYSIALSESHLLPAALTEVLIDAAKRGALKPQPVLSVLIEVAAKQGLPQQMAPLMQQLLIAQDTSNILKMTTSMKSQGLTVQSLLRDNPPLSQAWEEFTKNVVLTASKPVSFDDALTVSTVVESIQCLAFVEQPISEPVLRTVLQTPAPPDVHRAALEAAALLPDPVSLELMGMNLEQRTPLLRSTVITGLLATEPRIAKLLDLVESNQISFLEIGQTRLASLQQVQNPEIQERLKKLVAANAPADRSKVLEEYQAALAHEHDPLRGRELFSKNCAQCHKIGDLGVDVAPNISDSRVKTHEQLLVDILDPNRAVDNNYFSYTLVDTSGKVSTGIISSETSSSVTLKQPEGKIITLLRSEIEQLKPNGASLMPVGFEKQLTVAQLADVISFVKNWRYLDGQVPKEVIK